MTSLVQKHGSQYKVIKRERSLGGGGGKMVELLSLKVYPFTRNGLWENSVIA